MLQVKGEQFAQGARLSINGVETTVISVGADGKSLVARAKLGRAAEPGSQPVIVANPDGTSNAAQKPPVLFSIILGNPEIHQITPSRFTFGQWASPVSITGINFANGATLTIDRAAA